MKKNKLLYLIGSISVIVAAVSWSLDWIFLRPHFYDISAINLVFLEHFLWALLLSPFIFFWYKKLKTIKRNSLLSLFWVSFFWWLIWTLAITEAFFAAFRWETTLSTVIILQKLQPVFALFLASIILKEKLSKRFYLFAVISIISAYFIAFGDWKNDILNIDLLNSPALYAFIAAFSFGSSTVFWKSLVDDIWFKLTTALRFLFTSILAFFTLLIFSNISSIFSMDFIHRRFLFIIVFSSWAVALFLYYFWLKKIPASAATIFELAWPLSAIFFDYIFNWKFLSPIQLFFSTILIFCFFMIVNEWKWISWKNVKS